ncbi:MAG TPA: hypothetical protein VMA72_16385 [Streptosporangiaceae bacterium]|nr:hypothetical protein [Streptosporangiaceae bacterium]
MAPSIQSEQLIASSNAVLQAASRTGPLSFSQLASHVKITVASPAVLAVTVTADSPAAAEAAADAVASSFVTLVSKPGDPGAPNGPVTVRMMELATPATGTTPQEWLAELAAAGALVGAMLGMLLAWPGRRSGSMKFGVFVR